MNTPRDIAFLRFKWTRLDTQAWTDEGLRAQVIAFLDAFLAEHGWAKSWDVEERFTDNGVSVRVPAGPVNPPDPPDFKIRPGLRFLRLGVTRSMDLARFEVALSFPQGNATPGVPELLAQGRLSLRASEKLRRPIP